MVWRRRSDRRRQHGEWEDNAKAVDDASLISHSPANEDVGDPGVSALGFAMVADEGGAHAPSRVVFSALAENMRLPSLTRSFLVRADNAARARHGTREARVPPHDTSLISHSQANEDVGDPGVSALGFAMVADEGGAHAPSRVVFSALAENMRLPSLTRSFLVRADNAARARHGTREARLLPPRHIIDISFASQRGRWRSRARR